MNKYLKFIIFILIIIGLLIYTYCFNHEEKSGLIAPSQYTLQDRYDILKDDYDAMQDEYYELQGNYNDLQKEYEYDEDLIELLRNQLNSYGIEPYEL